MSKICCFCKYFHLDMGDRGYSEMTPPTEASIYCMKNHWEMSNYGEVEEYRNNIVKGLICPDYEQAK